MRRIGRESVRMGLVIAASLSIAWAPAVVVAQAPGSSDQSAATSPPAAPSQLTVAQTGTAASAPAPQSAAQVGDRLHDSAKSLGDAILDGIKYVGHKVSSFFTGEKS